MESSIPGNIEMDLSILETTTKMVGLLIKKFDFQGALSVLEATEDHLYIDDYNELVQLVLEKKDRPVLLSGQSV